MEQTTIENIQIIDQRIATDLVKFDELNIKIEELRTKYMSLVVSGTKDKEGLKNVTEARKDVKKKRIAAESLAKLLNEDALKYQRSVNARKSFIVSQLDPIETHLEKIEKAALAAIAEEKEIEKNKERALVASRTATLIGAGFEFNGNEYSVEDTVISNAQLISFSEEVFNLVLEKGKTKITELNMIKEAKAAEEKRLAEELEAKRVAELEEARAEKMALERQLEEQRIEAEKVAEAVRIKEREAAEKLRLEAEAEMKLKQEQFEAQLAEQREIARQEKEKNDEKMKALREEQEKKDEEFRKLKAEADKAQAILEIKAREEAEAAEKKRMQEEAEEAFRLIEIERKESAPDMEVIAGWTGHLKEFSEKISLCKMKAMHGKEIQKNMVQNILSIVDNYNTLIADLGYDKAQGE